MDIARRLSPGDIYIFECYLLVCWQLGADYESEYGQTRTALDKRGEVTERRELDHIGSGLEGMQIRWYEDQALQVRKAASQVQQEVVAEWDDQVEVDLDALQGGELTAPVQIRCAGGERRQSVPSRRAVSDHPSIETHLGALLNSDLDVSEISCSVCG